MPKAPPAGMSMKPPADVKPPKAAAPAGPHSHTAALVLGALLIGLVLGAAAGYYGGEFLAAMEKTATEMQAVEQQTQAQAEADATASSFSEVDTNPLQEIQTNPFE